MPETNQEQRNRRRSLVVAIALHAAVIAIFVFPFLTHEATKPKPYETLVELDFRQSAAAASADIRVRNRVERPKAERAAAPKNPAPPAMPTKPAPPILTAPSPLPPIKDIPAPKDPEPEPEPMPTPAPAPPVVAEAPSPEPGPPASTEDGAGDSNASGESTGAPETGEGETVSDVGEGLAPIGSALEGEGVLARTVVYRPDLGDIVRANGAIVLNLCINKQGRVIGVKYNEELSTIHDSDLVRKAIRKANDYRFETDYDAPTRECGTLSISIKGLSH